MLLYFILCRNAKEKITLRTMKRTSASEKQPTTCFAEKQGDPQEMQ